MDLRKPTCVECKSYLHYMENMPIKQKGVTMHFGERFCLGEKRARRFKRNDPKIYVPQWCPKRKTPCELRIYGFKNIDEWMMHDSLCYHTGKDILPEGRRYAVFYDLHTDLTPREFARCCNEKSDAETLHAAIHRYYVVEIDDGIKPTFFYKTGNGYQLLSRFDAEIAKKNIREDLD